MLEPAGPGGPDPVSLAHGRGCDGRNACRDNPWRELGQGQSSRFHQFASMGVTVSFFSASGSDLHAGWYS